MIVDAPSAAAAVVVVGLATAADALGPAPAAAVAADAAALAGRGALVDVVGVEALDPGREPGLAVGTSFAGGRAVGDGLGLFGLDVDLAGCVGCTAAPAGTCTGCCLCALVAVVGLAFGGLGPLGSVQVVLSLIWSTKYGRPFGAILISNPFGSGLASSMSSSLVRWEDDRPFAGLAANPCEPEAARLLALEAGWACCAARCEYDCSSIASAPSASSSPWTLAAPRRWSAMVMLLPRSPRA